MIDLALTRQDDARERARWAARARHGNARMLVIGAGVTGLTTALVLARRGRQVTVVADRFAPDVVSTVAGALWEWPPSVCGRHHDEPALDHAARWAMTSYQAFAQLAANPQTGVVVRPQGTPQSAGVSRSTRDLSLPGAPLGVQLGELVDPFEPGLDLGEVRTGAPPRSRPAGPHRPGAQAAPRFEVQAPPGGRTVGVAVSVAGNQSSPD